MDRVGRLDADLLDRLGVDSPTYRAGELERFHVAEHRRGADVSYLIARDEYGAVAGMVPIYLSGPPWEPAVDPATAVEPPAALGDAPLCHAGSAGAFGNFLEVNSALSGAAAARVATALVEQVLTVAREAGCRYAMLPYLDQVQYGWLRAFEAAATAHGVRDKAVLSVDPAWQTFEDYLQSLPSHRRVAIRSERRRFERSAIEVRERRLSEVAADLAPLLTQTENRYDRGVDREQMEFYLLMLGMHMDGDSLTLVAYRDGQPVAFSLRLHCGDRWIMRAWGCDYAALGREAAYFNLVYYVPILRAIECRASQIDFGVGAQQAKRLRGCDLVPLRTLLVPATWRR